MELELEKEKLLEYLKKDLLEKMEEKDSPSFRASDCAVVFLFLSFSQKKKRQLSFYGF